jgi:hypothetical protein
MMIVCHWRWHESSHVCTLSELFCVLQHCPNVTVMMINLDNQALAPDSESWRSFPMTPSSRCPPTAPTSTELSEFPSRGPSAGRNSSRMEVASQSLVASKLESCFQLEEKFLMMCATYQHEVIAHTCLWPLVFAEQTELQVEGGAGSAGHHGGRARDFCQN